MENQNLPTYQQLVNALCDYMDGVQDHEVQENTGLPDEDAQHIIDVRKAVLHLWET